MSNKIQPRLVRMTILVRTDVTLEDLRFPFRWRFNRDGLDERRVLSIENVQAQPLEGEAPLLDAGKPMMKALPPPSAPEPPSAALPFKRPTKAADLPKRAEQRTQQPLSPPRRLNPWFPKKPPAGGKPGSPF